MLQHRATYIVLNRGLAASASAGQSVVKKADEAHKDIRTTTHRHNLKVSRLHNGLMVGSIDTNRPVGRLGLVFRAGSRFETSDNLGVSHRLRDCVGLASQRNSGGTIQFRAARIGSSLLAHTTRDHFCLRMDFLRDFTMHALTVLGEVGCLPGFLQWELDETAQEMEVEKRQLKLHPERHAIELLHQAAFRRGGLANSLYSPDFMIGKHTTELTQDFANTHMVSGEAALVGVNVDHEVLLDYAVEYFPVAEAPGQPVPASPYQGGEVRESGPGALAHVIIACPGPSLADVKEAATFSVLGSLLGSGSRMSWSSGHGLGKTAKAISDKLGDVPFGTSSVSVAHSDCGLFGLYVASPAEMMGDVLVAAIHPVKEVAGGVKEEELIRAKAIARSQLLGRADSGEELLDELAAQLLVPEAEFHIPLDLIQLVDAVTAADVQQAASKLMKSKPSMAAIGRLEHIPYLDEIWTR